MPPAPGAPLALAGLHACAVTAGPLDPRVTFERTAAPLAALEGPMETQKGAATTSADEQQRLSRALAHVPALLEGMAQTIHLLSQQLTRRIQANGDTLLFYEATPRLAIVSLDPTASGLSLDLRRNALRTVSRGGQGPQIVRANLARGVLDGVIEDAMTTQALAALPSASPFSTAAILDRARADGIGIVAVSARSALGTLAVPDVARARLAAALEGQKQVVVAPQRVSSTSSPSRFAWWQVDAATGDTIGVLDNGLHGGQVLPGRAAELQVGRVGAQAMMRVGPMDVAEAYKAGLAAGQAASAPAATAAMAQGVMMGIGIVLAVASYIVVGILIGRATS